MPLSPAESGIGSPGSFSNVMSPYPSSVMSPSPSPAASLAEMMLPPFQVEGDTVAATSSVISSGDMDELESIVKLIESNFASDIEITGKVENEIQDIMSDLYSNSENENVTMILSDSNAMSFDNTQ